MPVLLCFVSPREAGAAKPHANKVKQAPSRIWTLAMDGSRVAYTSGGKIRVWNTATGATSVVGGRYGSPKNSALVDNTASELAIAGNRVAWIKRRFIGNTEASEKLYTATLGGSRPPTGALIPLRQRRSVGDDGKLDRGRGRLGRRSRGQHLEVGRHGFEQREATSYHAHRADDDRDRARGDRGRVGRRRSHRRPPWTPPPGRPTAASR